MDRGVAQGVACGGCIPHTRGDGPGGQNVLFGPIRYSPHAWGWTEPLPWQAWMFSVFPTRVGMDRNPDRATVLLWSIPHTRGDGPHHL